MSLEVFGDDGLSPGEITAEDLERAGWNSNPEATIWWKYTGEEMSFEDACTYFDEQRQGDLEDYL